MNKLARFGASVVVLSAALAGAVQAQTIHSVAPEASSPGVLLTIDGTGLANTSHVRFTANVGGFVGVWVQDEPVVSVSDTRVTVVAADIVAAFITDPPFDGDPFGLIQTADNSVSPAVVSNQLAFYFFEGSKGFLENKGLGSSQSTGIGRSVISFTLAGGPPTAGNPGFTATLHNAIPGAKPFLAIGPPAPSTPIGDGFLVVDPNTLFAIFPGPLVDPNGDSSAALAIPPVPSGIDVMMQWAYRDPVTGEFVISNGMQASY